MTRRKRTGFVFVLVAVACLVAATLVFASARPVDSAPRRAAASAAGVATPLWSPRRIPVLLARTVEGAAQAEVMFTLTRSLSSIVAATHACVAVDGQVGALARVGGDLALAPASTMKLLTATTAIERLGSDHRFTTGVVSDGSGDLVVVGGGDPLLSTPEHVAYVHGQARSHDAPVTQLSALADAIVAAGVHEVRGAILVDDRAHDSLRFLPAWKPIYTREGDVGSLGALAVDGGFDRPNDTVAAADPALTTGQRLAALLAARGVNVAGGVHRAPPDAAVTGREIAHVDSPPLSAIVAEMLTSSDNFTAETLVRDIAAATTPGTPATTAAGVRIVEHQLAALGVPTARLVMQDGSGLAHADRASCATMLPVIELSSQPKFAAVNKGLPIAGQTGTLVGRFLGGPLAGKLRAKTGSITGVIGLVGVIDRPDELHFAFLANGDFSSGAGSQLQADVASAIGSTPDLRAPTDLVPAP